MRTIRSTLVAATCVSLLALGAVGTAAQSDSCTGILEFSGEAGAEGLAFTATDPRLSGEAQGSGGWSLYEAPSEDAGTTSQADASLIIINEDGSWSCSDSSPAGPEPDLTGHTLVFSGTGDYEGLTAHVRIDWDEYPFSFTGVIVEGGGPEDPTLRG